MTLMNFVKKYDARKGNLIERPLRTVIVAFPSPSSDPSSRFYHQYCKHMLIKHNPWIEQICNAWGGAIVDPATDQITDDDEIHAVKNAYKSKFHEFKSTVDVGSLEMFNADAGRLRRIRDECALLYNEEQDALGDTINEQDVWMQMVSIGPQITDGNIPEILAPVMDPCFDWIQQRYTPAKKVEGTSSLLQDLKQDLILAERNIPEITFDMLALEQKHVYNLATLLLPRVEGNVIMILGPPGSGKSTTSIHSISKMANDFQPDSVLRLGNTGTAAFVIAGATCHSTLRLPINRSFREMTGQALRNLKERFNGKRVVIIDEVFMMGRKMLVQIERRLRQASGREDLPYGGFLVILVGDFHQLPPVGDEFMYTEGNAETSTLYNNIQNVIMLKQAASTTN